MILLKTAFTSVALLAGGLFAMMPESADAQIRFQIGGSNGYGNNSGYQSYARHDHAQSGYRSNSYRYGNPYHGFYGGQSYNRGYSTHNNYFRQGGGHYDYLPTTATPHRGHVDVQPGHYDLHGGGYGH